MTTPAAAEHVITSGISHVVQVFTTLCYVSEPSMQGPGMLDAPIQFNPILVPKVWGGRRLETLGKTLPPETAMGESWEIADLPGDGPTTLAISGLFEGQSLRSMLATHSEDIMGRVPLNQDGCFPLLIKYLDASDDLSVQVHPDQAWADQHPEAHLKSEAWVVMDAEPDSRIWAGVKPGIDAVQLQAALEADTLTECLESREAIVGSCHMLPSGTCHALGRGVLVAEVQTTSDTTFRLWDWGRSGREMHVPEALACINFEDEPPQEVPPPPTTTETHETVVAQTPWFTIRRVDCSAASTWRTDLQDAPMVLMCLEGAAHATAPGGIVPLTRGSTALLPASLAQATLELGDAASILLVQPHASAGT